MSQNDYVIADQTGASFLVDLNSLSAAIVSNNSAATEPATMYAYQWWADTNSGLLKQRNAANNAWVTIGTMADANLGLLSKAGGAMTGTITNFTSTGIDDNATSTSITIDANENVGIGVVPEAWHSSLTALQIGATVSLSEYNDGSNIITLVGSNNYYDGNYKYLTTNKAALQKQINGTHVFEVAASGTADAAISWTTAMTINNSGNVGIGVAPEAWDSVTRDALQIGGISSLAASPNAGAGSELDLQNNAYIATSGVEKYIVTDEASKYNQINGTHAFKVAPSGTADAAISWTTAMSIANNGNVATTGTIISQGALGAGPRNNFMSTDRISVSSSTVIWSPALSGSNVGIAATMLFTNGYNTASSTNSFADIVLYISGVAPSVVSSVNRGSPAARTYAASGGSLALTMASGTYNVANSSIEQAC